MMSRLAKHIVLGLSVLVFSYVTLGYVLGKTTEDQSYRSLSVFSEVLQHIQQDYVEEPNLPSVTVGALHGLLESLDPLSSYMSPPEYADFKKKSRNGAKGETGLALSKRFGYVAVVAVLPDSPAQKAGLRSGDILEAVAGFSTREMSVAQARVLLAGEPGTTVKVSVVRRGRAEPQEVGITRVELAAPQAVVDKLEADIAYLSVPALNKGKANEIRERLLHFERQGARKLILDLRDSAFGEASEGIAVARLFVPSGVLATLKGQAFATQEFAAEPAEVVWKHPMTVLISGGTSGAAELLAAAIAGNKRGDAVGERTFGTASEQKLIELEDGAALVLTVANYYTPDGKSIPDDGVAPTVEVRSSSDNPAELEDDLPPGGTENTVRPANRQNDKALRKAIELLLAPTRVESKGEARHSAALTSGKAA